MRPIDTLPLHDLIDDFRHECMMAKVLNGSVETSMMPQIIAGLANHGPILPRGVSKYVKPQIDFDACHVLDFGYMFNFGSNMPDVLTEEDVLKIKQPAIRHGVALPYPKMLFVERTAHTDRTPLRGRIVESESRVFITYIYVKSDRIAMEYYVKDHDLKHWMKFGHVEDIGVESNGVMERTVKSWGMVVPWHAMPAEDQSPINHYVRMTITLIAMLMRRGDEVEQVPVERDRSKPLKGVQRKNVQSVSVIHLHKQRLVNNLVDEDQAVPERSVTPHDRGGTVAHRIKDLTCQHVWVEEYRDVTRWRSRCRKCDSCEFWRSAAKVKGGAAAIVLHTVVP